MKQDDLLLREDDIRSVIPDASTGQPPAIQTMVPADAQLAGLYHQKVRAELGVPTDVAKLAGKILDVMKEMLAEGSVKKSGWNRHLNKGYSTMPDILDAILPKLIAKRVLPVPDVLLTERYEIDTRPDEQGHSDKRQAQDVLLRIQFIDCETGAVIAFRAAGTGMDSGDKAVLSAQTSALRSGLKAIFLIYDDDPVEGAGGAAAQNKRAASPQQRPNAASHAPAARPAGEAPPCPRCKVPTEWRDGKFLCPQCNGRVLV